MSVHNTTTADHARPQLLASLWSFAQTQRTLLMGLAGFTITLGFWHFAVFAFNVPTYLVPSPAAVIAAIQTDFGLLASNAVPTIIEAFMGFLIGNTFAILLAASFVYAKPIEELFYPVAILIKTIPIIAIAPVLKIVLGNGYEPKIAIAALVCFFPTLVNAIRGFRSVDSNLLELMHVLSASKREVFVKVRIQSSLPYIFAALKISVTMCVLGAIVGEWIGANHGIGYILIQASYVFDTPRLFAAILTASTIAIAGFSIVSLVEKWVIRWDAAAVA